MLHHLELLTLRPGSQRDSGWNSASKERQGSEKVRPSLKSGAPDKGEGDSGGERAGVVASRKSCMRTLPSYQPVVMISGEEPGKNALMEYTGHASLGSSRHASDDGVLESNPLCRIGMMEAPLCRPVAANVVLASGWR
jgi:hypothetical protein